MAWVRTNGVSNTMVEWTTGEDSQALGFTTTVGRFLAYLVRDFDGAITWSADRSWHVGECGTDRERCSGHGNVLLRGECARLVRRDYRIG